jgi:hypothetical protein
LSNLSVFEMYELMEERKKDFSSNYNNTFPFNLSTTINSDLQGVIGTKKSYYFFKLSDKGKKYFIKRPISVKLYQDEDLFFAENENLNVCGTGDTYQEALTDLKLHILHFFHYYQGIDEKKLIGEGIRLKKLYTDLLVEEENAS